MNLLKGKNYHSYECIFDVHSFATELDEDTLRTKVNGGCCDSSAPSVPPAPPSGGNTPVAPAITGTTPTTNPGTSPTTNTPNPSDPSNPGSDYTGGGYEPPPEVMSNPQAYGYWKALQALAEQQGDPDRYKDYNVLGDTLKKQPSNLRDRGYPSSFDKYQPPRKKDLRELGYPSSVDGFISVGSNLKDRGYPSSMEGFNFVPEAPYWVDISRNVEEAKKMSPFDFYKTVKNKGKWDYKQLDIKYEDFGNFNYGITGSAAGFSPEVLKRAAGFAQWRAGNNNSNLGSFLGGYPYGDDFKDQIMIQKGIDYYNEKYKHE